MKPRIKKHFYGGYWYCEFDKEPYHDQPGRGPTPLAAYLDWCKRNRFEPLHVPV